MNNNSENHGSARSPPLANEISLIITAIKIVILAICLVPFVKFTLISKQDNENSSYVSLKSKSEPEETVTFQLNLVNNELTRYKLRNPQPVCPRADILLRLNEICSDVSFKFYFCSPEDVNNPKKHKIPRYHIRKKSNNDPTVPAIINYVVGGLLITSLGAALVEYYKAKIQPTKKDGKAPLSRKCSLADLTVMKHHRKELIRRDSILEIPEERHKPFGRDVSRSNLRFD